MVTLRMLSERCGVSVAAVSKALNGRQGISPEKAELVRRTARELGYYPNAAAKTLKTHRSMNIGILYQNVMANEYFSAILEGIRDTAVEYGYDITFLSNGLGEQGYYEHAMRRQCDGVLIVQPGYSEAEMAEALKLAESDLPVVAIDQIYRNRSSVTGDNLGGLEEVVSYLYGLGHRRLAFIHGEMGDVTRQRLAGFYRACRARDIQVPDEYVIEGKYQNPDVAAMATRQLLQCRELPTCILYSDDTACLGGIGELSRQGLRVPEDISCFGYDGSHIALLVRPTLATHDQNCHGIGEQAVRELISAIEDAKCFVPRNITVTGSVHPGGSVKDLTKS